MKKTLKQILTALVSIMVLVGLDQVSKILAVAYLKDKDPFVILDGIFELRYLENHGAAFGILQNQQIFFYILTVVVILGLIWLYMFRIPMGKKYLPLNLVDVALIAGACGNLIDRVQQSYVVDFFYFKLIDFPIFNVADCYVTCSCVLLFALILFFYKEEDLQGII